MATTMVRSPFEYITRLLCFYSDVSDLGISFFFKFVLPFVRRHCRVFHRCTRFIALYAWPVVVRANRVSSRPCRPTYCWSIIIIIIYNALDIGGYYHWSIEKIKTIILQYYHHPEIVFTYIKWCCAVHRVTNTRIVFRDVIAQFLPRHKARPMCFKLLSQSFVILCNILFHCVRNMFVALWRYNMKNLTIYRSVQKS